jgi:hypothetical protein
LRAVDAERVLIGRLPRLRALQVLKKRRYTLRIRLGALGEPLLQQRLRLRLRSLQ